MEVFLAQLVNGLALGSIYAVFAMGFGLVFATMGILNIAHGVYATWGAIAGLWVITNLGLGLIPSILLGVVFAGLVAVMVDQLAFEPLRRRDSTSGAMLGPIITSIGFWIILTELAIYQTSARVKAFPRDVLPRGLVTIGPIDVPVRQVYGIALAGVVTLALYVFIHRTQSGARMRAVGTSAASASLAGVNPKRVIRQTAFIAGATSGLSGLMLGVSTNVVTFQMGENLLLKGFAAVIIGGFGDIRGAALGGIIIGIAEVFGAQYVSTAFRDAITFGLLVLFLLYRPKGILGTTEVKVRS